MTNFSDDGHAAELAAFWPGAGDLRWPCHGGAGAETIAIAVDLKARALPAFDAWIKARDTGQGR